MYTSEVLHILVTNDDGVTSPGLLALAQAMRQFGAVSVLAPDKNWSGCGHVKTLNRPLRVNEVTLADGTVALAGDGAPSDCVALAIMGLLPLKIDLVVSGINPMANLGHDVTYSGTVTAAMEANIAGIPGVAVSLDGGQRPAEELRYETAAHVAALVVADVIKRGLPDGVFLNVNVPCVSLGDLRGIHLTRQGLRVYRDRLVKRKDPRGHDYYWIGGDLPTGIPEDGTDVGALIAGYAAVTPLQLDLTAHSVIPALRDWPVVADETGLTVEAPAEMVAEAPRAFA